MGQNITIRLRNNDDDNPGVTRHEIADVLLDLDCNIISIEIEEDKD